MSFDPRCYDLAELFLSDEPKLNTPVNRNLLAQDIQDAIESTIASLRSLEEMVSPEEEAG